MRGNHLHSFSTLCFNRKNKIKTSEQRRDLLCLGIASWLGSDRNDLGPGIVMAEKFVRRGRRRQVRRRTQISRSKRFSFAAFPSQHFPHSILIVPHAVGSAPFSTRSTLSILHFYTNPMSTATQTSVTPEPYRRPTLNATHDLLVRSVPISDPTLPIHIPRLHNAFLPLSPARSSNIVVVHLAAIMNTNNDHAVSHSEPIPIHHPRHRAHSLSDSSSSSASSDGSCSPSSPVSPTHFPLAGTQPRIAPISPSTTPILNYFLSQSPKSSTATFPFRRGFGTAVFEGA